MTQISKTFPYLSIAKKHDVDYGKVLGVAHILTHGTERQMMDLLMTSSSSPDTAVLVDVQEAVMHFRGIQGGVIPFLAT